METTNDTITFAETIYTRMAVNLQLVRERVDRPLTLTDKLLLGHLDRPSEAWPLPGAGYLRLRPDRVVLQDVLGQTAMLQLAQTDRAQVAVPTSIHCDHLIEARRGALIDLATSRRDNDEVYAFLRSAAAKYGAVFWEPGAGIIHQVVLENYAFPGQLILGTDSHTPNAGGLGACAVGVGGADAVEVMAGLSWELLSPRRIAVVLTGELSGWTSPKDVIAWVAGKLSVSGATNAVVEYIGPGTRTLSATGKATITNMGAELGATTSLFPADDAMATYLRATDREGLGDLLLRHLELLTPDAEAERDPERCYDQVLELDLSALEPHVVGPHSPDRARPISELAREIEADPHFVDAISVALIGSCTNSSYEDMSRAADIARQASAHGLSAACSLFVSPGSERIRATVARDGQLGALEAMGATVLANACGPCIGQWRREDDAADSPRVDQGEPSTIVTSFNRNFPGRNDGRVTTMSFIASPEIVTALAMAGRLSFNPLTDSLVGADGREFRLTPPRREAACPEHGFAATAQLHIDPTDVASATASPRGAAIDLVVSSDSTRLQRLERWPAWDGSDLCDMPLLIKTRGKTTTDQIAPAGPWLRYRGHLDRFSDNLLLGAIDAFTGVPGDGLAARARAWRAAGERWVVVGDSNYGEGSSREHAALSPRWLGAAAVIARSFARIHETNLKKQGLLALTFGDAEHYNRVRAGDRVSLLHLGELAAGRPVTCILHHVDGTREEIELHHSYSDTQLGWFRSGSALNAMTT